MSKRIAVIGQGSVATSAIKNLPDSELTKEQPNIPESDLLSLSRGERPEGMDFETFKKMRKLVQLMDKSRVRGKFIPNKK